MLGLALLAAASLIPAFEPKPCTAENAADPTVVCGDVRVPEDRSHPNGRTIALNVVVLKARSVSPDLPPLVDIDGGPGLASTRSAAFYRVDGIAYRARRDVILVDQRGTGGSNPLSCPKLAIQADLFDPLYPPGLVADCRAELSKRTDLRQYGTSSAVADLDAVRTALGHERLDIVALSYGTTVALRYLATYPGRTRAAVLSGTVPAEARPPQHHAVVAQQALAQVFADCGAEPACRTAFPDLAGDLQSARAKLDPARAEVFMEKVRSLLYAPFTARQVPFVVHRAAAGDLAPLRKIAGTGAPTGYFDGLYLSVTCSESIALLDYPKAAAAARSTLFGDYRLRRQRDACAAWPKARVPAGFLAPVRSSAAILLLSGGRDPVTPHSWTARAAATLPNSRVVSIPWSGHAFDGLANIDTCYDPLVVRFFDTGDAKVLAVDCLATMLPPPFKVAD